MNSQVSDVLIEWYLSHKRELPWRNSKNPYHIWISEIILQQTRVDQGLPYYHRFLKKFPSVQSLAEADQDEVLHLWQGLGYYSRARNLHTAAKTVINDHGGSLPDNYDGLKQLKGIGDYTASAIASFAFSEAKPVIDGNVIRFLSRFFGVDLPVDSSAGLKTIRKYAEQILNTESSDKHNQAIMEFGALQCTPVKPDCPICVFKSDCKAFNTNTVSTLPIKKKSIRQRNRYFNYLLFISDASLLIRKRVEKDIWQGLYELPLIEEELESEESLFNCAKWQSSFAEINPTITGITTRKKHLLSHQAIHPVFFEMQISSDELSLLEKQFTKISIDELQDYAYPVLLTNYFKLRF